MPHPMRMPSPSIPAPSSGARRWSGSGGPGPTAPPTSGRSSSPSPGRAYRLPVTRSAGERPAGPTTARPATMSSSGESGITAFRGTGPSSTPSSAWTAGVKRSGSSSSGPSAPGACPLPADPARLDLELLREEGEEGTGVGDDPDDLLGPAVHELRDRGRVDVHADRLNRGGKAVPHGDGVEEGRDHENHAAALQLLPHGVLGRDHVRDHVGERAVVPAGPREDVGYPLLHALVHDPALHDPLLHRVPDGPRPDHLADGLEVVAVTADDRFSRGKVHPEGRPYQAVLDVMGREGISC